MNDASSESLTFASVFLIGLGLNLTPCVYPMLSVTVSLFSGKKDVSKRQSFFKALVYVLGIATMFSALGTATAFTGGLFGSLLQNRWVLIGISLFFVVLALGMFGHYAFQFPHWLVQRIGGRKFPGMLGIYFAGLAVGIFAAPCIGPPILGLLAFIAIQGDPWLAFRIFFVLSLGLGLPYLVLGTSSHLLAKLPKSGIWLTWMEKFFGFGLLVLAGFYFILAVNSAWLRWLAPAALILGGLYLGFLDQSKKYSARFNELKRALGVLAVTAGILIPFLGARDGVKWQSYSPEKLQQAAVLGKPVIIDFYADWCLPCHELDNFTYSNAKVVKTLEGYEKFKVNLTQPEDPAAADAIERFEILGVPTIVFLGPDGKEVKAARLTGFAGPDDFIKNLPVFQEKK